MNEYEKINALTQTAKASTIMTEAMITAKIHMAEINQLDKEHKFAGKDSMEWNSYIKERRKLIEEYKRDMNQILKNL